MTQVDQIKHRPSSAFPERADLDSFNEQLLSFDVDERLFALVALFGEDKLALCSSGGIDAVVHADIVGKSPYDIPVINLDTRHQHLETKMHMDTIEKTYGLRVYRFGPSDEDVQRIKDEGLRDNDEEEYRRLTKKDPLGAAVFTVLKNQGALIMGARWYHSKNRARKPILEEGDYGAMHVNLTVDWTEEQVRLYKAGLIAHLLEAEGYGSVDDDGLTVPGKGRNGRKHDECSILNRGVILQNPDFEPAIITSNKEQP